MVAEVTPELEPVPAPKRAALAAAAGIASAALLGASLAWAHHWNAATVTLVCAWGTSTLAALALGVSARARELRARWTTRIGLALGIVSVLALIGAGLAAAGGYDPTGGCGGG